MGLHRTIEPRRSLPRAVMALVVLQRPDSTRYRRCRGRTIVAGERSVERGKLVAEQPDMLSLLMILLLLALHGGLGRL
jgi:hypothetical protein